MHYLYDNNNYKRNNTIFRFTSILKHNIMYSRQSLSIDDSEFTILTKYSPRVEQPKDIKTSLYPHQLAMVKAAIELEKKEFVQEKIENREIKATTKIGVIGDLVGSGKSFITMGIINTPLVLKKEREIRAKSSDYWSFYETVEHPAPIRGIDVVVVPKSIFPQWKSAIKTHSKIETLAIENLRDLKKLAADYKLEEQNDNESPLRFSWDKMSEKNRCLLVSCNQFMNMLIYGITSHPKIQIDRLFYDEADTIKMSGFGNQPSFSRIRMEAEVKFTWLVSSTVSAIIDMFNIRGYKFELFSSISHMPRQLRKCIMLRNCDRFINESFNLPQPIIQTVRCRNSRMSNLLNGIVNRDVLNAINAGDVNGALSQFGGEQVADHDALIASMTVQMEDRCSNYRNQIDMLKRYLDTTSADRTADLQLYRSRITHYTNSLTALESRIKLLGERLSGNDASCPICLNPEIENKTIMKCCQNAMCFACFTQCMNNKHTCPLCRADVKSKSDVIIISDGEVTSPGTKQDNMPVIKTKEETIKSLVSDILKRDNNSVKKIMIYSTYSVMPIYNSMRDNNIIPIILSGTSGQITKKLNAFKKATVSECILLNTQHSGAGLNIQEATDIILYHNMSEDLTLQVMGRGQRFGRKGQLRIWRMANELEETTMASVDRLLNGQQ